MVGSDLQHNVGGQTWSGWIRGYVYPPPSLFFKIIIKQNSVNNNSNFFIDNLK